MKSTVSFITAAIAGSLLLSGCGDTVERLSRAGQAPQIAAVQNPQENPSYKPMTWPSPVEPVAPKANPSSLWQPGAKTFFRDQRANRVGDILRVTVEIDDQAQLDNETQATRNNSESLGVPSLFGLQERVFSVLPRDADPTDLVSYSGTKNNRGNGQIGRKEKIETEVAAVVTQVLPNGNMVISGNQEVRVNAELRQITIGGVIRPEDIANDNSVKWTQIAEARISYGGRGTLSDVQKPRWGSDVVDALSPF